MDHSTDLEACSHKTLWHTLPDEFQRTTLIMSSESSKGVPPRPPLQNPIAGTTIDTAPKTLGIDSGEQSRNDPAHSLIAQGAKKLFHLPGRSTSPSPLPSKPTSGRRISPRNSPDIVAPRIQRGETSYPPHPSIILNHCSINGKFSHL